jgi:hypothetical protein
MGTPTECDRRLAARAEQVEATSKSELSMSTLQKLVCNLDYSGTRKPDISIPNHHPRSGPNPQCSGTKLKAAFEIYFSCRPLQLSAERTSFVVKRILGHPV